MERGASNCSPFLLGVFIKMVVLIEKGSPFFDFEKAKKGYFLNQDKLDDENGFEHLFANGLFWNAYKKGYVGTLFAYQGEDERWYMGGWAERKRHKDCVKAVMQVADFFPVIYAQTKHLNAVICLKAAGFRWLSRDNGLLIRRKEI